jgi:beta-glucosidase/6-phospho-beta-glucosidase/beta-galactosidase
MFRSFFFAGYEGTTTSNLNREWIDQVAATQHDQFADDDYRRLREVGLHAAREAIRWPLVDHDGRHDFSSVLPFVAASRRHRVEVIWDLFHYGYPHDLDPFTARFVERFAGYCHAAARFIRREMDGPYYFTPVNEPSFFAWAGGEVGRFAPHCYGRGPELKVALIRAAIAGINAIRSVLPDARIVNVDPICRVVAPSDHFDPHAHAHDFNHRAVFEAWDMLCGRTMPELGGSPDHLDIVGVNYYWTNQWEIGREECPLAFDDPRRMPLAKLLRRVWKRYRSEILLTETSHADEMRPIWLNVVAHECEKLLDEGVPLRGVCLYPILGMPEWHDPTLWARMGLWDLVRDGDTLQREIYSPMLDALRAAQRLERKFAEFGAFSDDMAPASDRVEPTGETMQFDPPRSPRER